MPHTNKQKAGCATYCQSSEDIISLQRHVLETRSNVLLQVSLDLTLSLGAESRLVHWDQNHFVVAGQHHTVETRVDRADIFGRKLRELVETGETHDVLHRFDQFRHVADTVVETLDANAELLDEAITRKV